MAIAPWTQFIVYFLLTLPFVAAQDIVKGAASIHGTITEVPGGAPAPGVSIRLHGRTTSKTATTDVAGRYEWRNLPPGEYFISTHGDGYGKNSSGLLAPVRYIRLAAGQSLTADFEVKKEAGVSGHVLDDDRRPVPNAWVQVYARVFVNGAVSFGLCGSARTNDIGEYSISGLADGRYYVSAGVKLLQFQRRPPGTTRDPKPKVTDVGIFYPSEPSVVSASPIDLSAGEQRQGLDLMFARLETYCVAGSVAADRASSGGLSLIASHNGWSRHIANGKFVGNDEFEVCGIPPGLYRLEASTSNVDGSFLSMGQIEFAVGERNVTLDPVHLASGVKVRGKATVEGADPRESFPRGIRIALDPRGTQPRRMVEVLSTEIGASGDS